jgi:hypothetical protein
MMKFVNVEPGRRLDQALAWAYSRPGYEPTGVLFQAVQARKIGLTIVFSRRFAWSPRLLPSTGPRVVLIADDLGDSRDPDEWRCAISATAWARASIIHGTGGKVEHYREAVRAAELTNRCLMIETNSARAPAWVAAIHDRDIPGLVFIPPRGGVHPVSMHGGAA